MKDLLILGAGTAGTMMANHLISKLPKNEWQISIVDQYKTHYYQPGFLFLPFDIYTTKQVKKNGKKSFNFNKFSILFVEIAFILIVTLFLGGCATKGPSFSELAPSINELPSNAGRIYLYRTTIFGAALQPEVKINNEVVGKSIARGFFYVDKEPGN